MANPRTGKAPAFQFYPGDFLADENVAVMTLEEVGAYTMLMCFEWREGSVPADPKRLARMLKLPKDRFEEMWTTLAPCFQEHPEDAERLIHPRLERERVRQNEYRQKKIRAGKASGKSRRRKALRTQQEQRSNTDRTEGEQTRTLQSASAVEAYTTRGDGDSKGLEGSQPSLPSGSVSIETGPGARSDSPRQGSKRRGPKQRPPPAGDMSDAALMGLIRKRFYVPDGKPPGTYDEAREVTIIRELREAGCSGHEIADHIEGAALIRDDDGRVGEEKISWMQKGSKLTMRVLKAENGLKPLWRQAEQKLNEASKRSNGTEPQGPIRVQVAVDGR